MGLVRGFMVAVDQMNFISQSSISKVFYRGESIYSYSCSYVKCRIEDTSQKFSRHCLRIVCALFARAVTGE